MALSMGYILVQNMDGRLISTADVTKIANKPSLKYRAIWCKIFSPHITGFLFCLLLNLGNIRLWDQCAVHILYFNSLLIQVF